MSHRDEANSSPLQPASVPMPLVPGIRPPQPLTFTTNLADNWKLFKQRWNTYAILSNLDSHNRETKIALFLHTLADDTLKIYNGFHFNTPEADRSVNDNTQNYEDCAVGEVNETYERYILNKRCQEDETFENFYSSIRTLVKTCNYCERCVDSMLRDKIVLRIRNTNTQTEFLKVRNLTLKTCVDICKAAESVESQNRVLHPEITVDKIKYQRPRGRRVNQRKEQYSPGLKQCKFCGDRHKLRKEECPAYQKTCRKCGYKNHFECCCASMKGNKQKTQ